MRLITFILLVTFLSLGFSSICLAGSPVIWKGDRASSLADGIEAKQFFAIGTGGDGYVELTAQSSDPATPGSGSTSLRIFTKDKKLYYVTDDGAGTPVYTEMSPAGDPFLVNVINERTATSGVTVDGVLLKDNFVNTDQINEASAGVGVLVDSTLLKDGRVLATAGTESLPSLTFTTDPDTGLFRNGTNNMNVVTGGTNRMIFYSDGTVGIVNQLKESVGSQTLPSYTFNLDENTGMYSQSADNIAFTVGGTWAMRILSTGGVEISGTGGNAGNVPHGCRRSTGTNSSSVLSHACSANEIVTGGGCNCSDANYMRASYPITSNTWTCVYDAACTTLTVYAICCDY